MTDRLSPRELEVALLVCQRYTDEEIARALDISPNTVDRHLENIIAKIGRGQPLHRRATIRAWMARAA